MTTTNALDVDALLIAGLESRGTTEHIVVDLTGDRELYEEC